MLKRDFRKCKTCGRLREVIVFDSELHSYFCGSEVEQPFALFLAGDGIVSIHGGGTVDSHAISVYDWNDEPLPDDCRMYAEYFVEECNEEKA